MSHKKYESEIFLGAGRKKSALLVALAHSLFMARLPLSISATVFAILELIKILGHP